MAGIHLELGEKVRWTDSSNAAVHLVLDADIEAVRLQLNETQTAAVLRIDDNAAAAVFSVTPEVTTGTFMNLVADTVTTGTVIDLSDANALTTGIVVHVASSATAITGAGRLLYVNHSGTTSTSGILSEFTSANTDETVVLRVTSSAASTGTVLDLSAASMTTGTVLDIGGLDALTTGTGINLVSDSSDTGTRSLQVIKNDNTAATGTTCLEITQDALLEAMSIDMGTLDKGFINFKATADADATSAISTHGTAGATTDFIQIGLNGASAWIAVSTNDPSA